MIDFIFRQTVVIIGYKQKGFSMPGFILLIVFATGTLFAQPASVSVSMTELKFSDHSVKHGIKQAFLTFLSDTCVMYKDEKLVVGKPLYQNRPDEETNILKWYPDYIVAPEDGNLALSTGKYLLTSKQDGSKISLGRFYTIWKKEGKEYKVVFDNGGETNEEYLGADGDKLINSPVSGRAHTKAEFDAFYKTFENDLLVGKLSRDVLPTNFIFVTGNMNNSTFNKATEEIHKLRYVTKIEPLGSFFCSSGKLAAVAGKFISLKEKKPKFYFAVFSVQGEHWMLNTLAITD